MTNKLTVGKIEQLTEKTSTELLGEQKELIDSFIIGIDLARALGLIEGALEIKNMEDFNKEGLIETLEEVRDILSKLNKN